VTELHRDYLITKTAQQEFEELHPLKKNRGGYKVLNINLSGQRIGGKKDSSLTIANFPYLTEIELSNTSGINELIIENCPQLKKVDFKKYPNGNKELKINNCQKLTSVSCSDNNLKKLDIKNCPQLENLICFHNYLTDLDLSNCQQLKVLNCDDNDLINLTLPNDCSNLTELYCEYNDLTTLNLSNLNREKLKKIGIKEGNDFSESDLSVLDTFPDLKIRANVEEDKDFQLESAQE